MKKITARAHSNIAFIKYWGRKDEVLRLPTNGSISMNLSNLFTTTTVEFKEDLKEDDVVVNGEREEGVINKIVKHLDRIRQIGKIQIFAKVVSKNSFAASAGMASSASGFAALTLAAARAAGLSLSEKELSILARQGSGSACRSIPDGFVEWKDGDTSEESFAHSLYSPDYWDICDVIAVISKDKKDTSTTIGQQRVETSPFFATRIKHIQEKNNMCKEYIAKKDFENFGKLVEMEALELHSIMLTSWPSLIYLEPASLTIMKAVQKMRQTGLPAYFTIDAGPNIHIICRNKDKKQVTEIIYKLPGVMEVIENKVSKGAYIFKEDLF
jgi:diphosphomevalonate decarboxylase